MIRREANPVTLPLKYCETWLISWSRKTQRSTKTEKRRKIDLASNTCYEIPATTHYDLLRIYLERFLRQFFTQFNHIFGFEPRLFRIVSCPIISPGVGKKNGQVCFELEKRSIQTFAWRSDKKWKLKKRWSEENLKKMLDLEIIPEKAITTDNWEIV